MRTVAHLVEALAFKEDKQNVQVSTSQSKKSASLELMKEALGTSKEWKDVVELFKSEEFDLPKSLSQEYIKCFLIVGGEMKSVKDTFALALSKVLDSLNLKNVHDYVLEPYTYFFDSFVPTERYSKYSLKILFKLAWRIRANMNWLHHIAEPAGVLIDSEWLYHDKACIVAQVLIYQKDFYSAEFFDVVEDVFKTQTTSSCLANTIENFFDLIAAQEVVDFQISKDMMIEYAGLDNNYTFPLLKKQTKELETEAGRSFSNAQLIPLLRCANTKTYEAVKLMVRTLLEDAKPDDMAALLEDIEKELAGRQKFLQEKEEFKQQQLK